MDIRSVDQATKYLVALGKKLDGRVVIEDLLLAVLSKKAEAGVRAETAAMKQDYLLAHLMEREEEIYSEVLHLINGIVHERTKTKTNN